MSEVAREVRLTAEQIDYLQQQLELPEPLSKMVRAAQSQSVRLTSSEKNAIVEAVSDRLMEVGFDQHHEPTAEGRMLESIIDSLNTPVG
jgi:hypothetical protein